MPIENYHGNTFVAFMDISGFKNLMNTGGAIKALNCLYNNGYYALQRNTNIDGLFVSDSGILFVNGRNQNLTKRQKLYELLEAIKQINIAMLNENYMLTTSIAYGEFSYHQRIEFNGIEKNPIYGQAYVAAFLDNENSLPKIQPGQCRILLNAEINNLLNEEDENQGGFLRWRKNDRKHKYFYWNVETPEVIDEFERQYLDSYQAKYAGMLNALKNNHHY